MKKSELARVGIIALLVVSASSAFAATTAGGWIDITAPIDPKTVPIYPGDAPAKLDFLQHLDLHVARGNEGQLPRTGGKTARHKHEQGEFR